MYFEYRYIAAFFYFYQMITILGPTASGKTRLAAFVADRVDGEIISADSRQVYCGMDIGTGKDYSDYLVNDRQVPFHLIDIVDPGHEYSVYEFQRDFYRVYQDICSRGKRVVLCGGSGMYIESVLKGYALYEVPENLELREALTSRSTEELIDLLESFRTLHNVSDTTDRSRLVRAIEIQYYMIHHQQYEVKYPAIKSHVFGIRFDRQVHRDRITQRLRTRLEQGMVQEVERLIASGIKPEALTFYGLEYRFLTQYVLGELPYDEMFRLLNTAIHQFAKRQMTWFRRMERKGIVITWIDGTLDDDEKVQAILNKVV